MGRMKEIVLFEHVRKESNRVNERYDMTKSKERCMGAMYGVLLSGGALQRVGEKLRLSVSFFCENRAIFQRIRDSTRSRLRTRSRGCEGLRRFGVAGGPIQE